MSYTRRIWMGTAAAGLAGCTRRPAEQSGAQPAQHGADVSGEEYVWLAPHSDLPLFVAHDHPALKIAALELGVKATIAGPSAIDIPGLVAAIDQTVSRKPAGLLILGWDPSALIDPINRAIQAGVPVVCIDADVPGSKRYAFVGTDWFEVGRRQGEAMLKSLSARVGKVAMLGIIEQTIDQRAFSGFRDVLGKAGLTVMDPQHDKGNSVDAARVASGLIQGVPDLVGIAGFDSESGPGIGIAIREAGMQGKIVATCVDAEEQHLQLIQQGVLSAAIGQKRELFTYFGLKLLYEIHHSPLKLTSDDAKAGVLPIPELVYTGTYTVTRENVALFIKGKSTG
jgi:ribose transport system substrate-binding protein